MVTLFEEAEKEVKGEAEKLSPLNIFKPLKEIAPKRKLKISIWGKYKTGKTFMALTCPEPVYVIDTERGVTPLLKHFEDKEIYALEAFVENEKGRADPVRSLELVDKAINSLRDINKGTIVIDSGSDIYYWLEVWMKEKIRSELGRQTYQFDWSLVKRRYQEMMMKLLSRETVFVITGKTREVYIGSEKTGRQEPRWDDQTPYLTDVVVRIEKREFGEKIKPRYIGVIEGSRLSRKVSGIEIEDITYDKLLNVLKPYMWWVK